MENEKQKTKMNKMFMIPLFAILTIGVVFAAGFVVNTFTIQSDVYEAFGGIQYSIIGDAGNWDGTSNCSTVAESEWITLTGLIDVDGLFAGEGRMLCTRFNNLGEGNLDYTLSNEVVAGLGNSAECLYAFGENSVTGNVVGLGTAVDGYGFVVPMDATPVNDCQIEVSLIRG